MWVEGDPASPFLRELLAEDLPDWLGGVVHVESTESTMDMARERAREAGPAGTLIVAEEQTAGRGRRGAVWQAPRGKALTATLLLRPAAPPAVAQLYSLASAIAIARAVQQWGVDARTKWPNDVWVGDAKLAGVLIEMAAGRQDIGHVAIGFGVNVGQSQEELPPVSGPSATSVWLETGEEIPRGVLCARVLAQLDRLLGPGLAPETERIVHSWRELDICLSRPLRVRLGREEFGATAEAIAPTGELRVRDENGRLHELSAGEVSIELPAHPPDLGDSSI